MKKYFVVADVHGFYTEMQEALKNAGFDIENPNHIFVSLGDLLDRGSEAEKCLDFVNSLPNERKVLIVGNHEILMQDMISRCWVHKIDKSNKTFDTAVQLYERTRENENPTEKEYVEAMKNNKKWKKYFDSCVYYYEVKNNVFVHGWLAENKKGFLGGEGGWNDWRNASDAQWEMATWKNGMEMWGFPGYRDDDLTVWCGHWHTSWGHHYIEGKGPEFDTETEKADFSPFIHRGIKALDACTAYSGKVNCLTLEVEDE